MIRCRQLNSDFGWNRQPCVFFAAPAERWEREEPLINVAGALQLENLEAIGQLQAANDNFHGLLITDDQAMENVRLNIREHLRASMEGLRGGRRAELQILDHRINEALRQRISEQIAAERRTGIGGALERAGSFFQRKFMAGHGFFGNIRRLFSRETDVPGSGVREIYGESVSIEDRVRNISRAVWDGLNNLQQMQIQQALENFGVPLPPPPPWALGPRQLQQLCNASADHLKRLRAALPFLSSPMIAGPVLPNMPAAAPATSLDRLIELQEIHEHERRKLTSYSVYHPQRLQTVLDQIRRTNPDLQTLLNDILQENALLSLDNPEAQALVAELERRWTGDATLLRQHLEVIRNNLPTEEAKAEEGKEETLEQERQKRCDEICQNLLALSGELGKSYSRGRALGRRLWGANRDVADTSATPTSNAHRQAIQQRGAVEKETAELHEKVGSFEKEYRRDAENLLRLLNIHTNPIPPHAGPPPDPQENLRLLRNQFGHGMAGPQPTTLDELFGDTDPANPYIPPGPAAFEIHVTAFSDDRIKTMRHEIKAHYTTRFRPRKKTTARQLLYMLREAELARQGYTNEATRMKLAFADADDLVADARNKGLARAVNNELSEYLGGTTWGSHTLDRMRKYLKAKIRPEEIFEAQDVIDRVTGSVQGMEVFDGITPDMSRMELQYYVDNNAITPVQLRQFMEHMHEAIKGFTMSAMEGRVELYDIDAPRIEQLLKLMQRLGSIKAAEASFQKVSQMEGNKYELMLAQVDEYEKQEYQEEKDFIEKIRDRFADWKSWFSNNVLKRVFGERYREARKMKREQKMSEGEFQEYLKSNNLLAVGGVLGTAVTAAEMYGTGKKAAGWTWNKVKGGSGWTYDKGKRGLGFVWRNAARPVGKYALVKPAEYLIWKPVKWTATTAGKVAAFPFVLAGTMVGKAWNWAGGKGSGAWSWARGKS